MEGLNPWIYDIQGELTHVHRRHLPVAGFTHPGCSNVQVIRLTSDTFPSRPVREVAILSEEPGSAHVKIAELSESSSSDVQALQRHLLKKAAETITRTEQRIDYQSA